MSKDVTLRIVDYAKWKKSFTCYKENRKVAGYPITNDLKTCKLNKLSVWIADIDSEEDMVHTILTMAASRQLLQDLDVAIIELSKLEECGIEIENEPGISMVKSGINKHKNIINLDNEKINSYSFEILEFLMNSDYNPGTFTKRIRYTQPQLIGYFVKYIKEGKLSIEDLDEAFRKKIEPRLEGNATSML